MSDFSKTPNEAALISFGLGGHSIEFKPCGSYGASSLSGYEDPETFQNRFNAGDYTKYKLEGARVIDKRRVVEDNPHAVSIVLAMPMLGAGLAPNEVDSFGKRHKDDWFLKAIADNPETGQFGAMARLGMIPGYRGLDYVGIDIYTALWRRHGARIGVFSKGTIVWDDTLGHCPGCGEPFTGDYWQWAPTHECPKCPAKSYGLHEEDGETGAECRPADPQGWL